MNTQQPTMAVENQNGNGHPTIRTFSQEQLESTFQNYRTGVMELKAQKEALLEEKRGLEDRIHELELRIARTEGAALGLQNILNPQPQG